MKTALTARTTLTAALMMAWGAQAAAEGIYDSLDEISNPPVPHAYGYRGADFGVAVLDGAVDDYQVQPAPGRETPPESEGGNETGFGVAVLDEGIDDYGTGT